MVQLQYANWLQFPKDWYLPSHAHDHHELIVIHAGAMTAKVGTTETVHARAGHTLLYRSGVPHEESAVGNVALKMVCISFTGTLDGDCENDLLANDPRGRARYLSAWLSELQAGPRSTASLGSGNALLSALLSDRHTSLRIGGTLVQRVQAYVSEHLHEQLTLARLADFVGLSPYHFARGFRATAGIPPMAFVRLRRIESAQVLLANPSIPLRVIASLVGFRDEFELSRVYKRVTGSSPRAGCKTTRFPPQRPRASR